MKRNIRKFTALCLILTIIVSLFGSQVALASGTGSAGVEYTTSPRTVTFLLNDETNRVHAAVEVIGGKSIETTPDAQMPAIPVRAGYSFAGWSTTPSGAGEWFTASTVVIDNITVYARWAQHWYTVQFVDRDGTPISTMRVPHGGDAIAPPNPSSTGWIFIGWDRPFTNVTEDITVRAVYRAIEPTPTPPPVVPTPTPTPTPTPPPVAPTPQPPTPPPPSPSPVSPVTIVRPPAPPPPPAEPPQDELPPEEPPPEEPPEILTIEPAPVPAAAPELPPEEPVQIIEEPEAPLASPGFIFFAPWGADYWALLNLILAVLGAILTPIALIKVLQRRKHLEREVETKLNSLNQNETYIVDEEKLYQRRRIEWFAATAVLGGIGILIFVLTQDMRKTMALMDWWTIFHAIVFILEAIAFRLIYKYEDNEEDKDSKNVKVHQN
jgi:uncharacterized repeat protein (TIGR02543 family)